MVVFCIRGCLACIDFLLVSRRIRPSHPSSSSCRFNPSASNSSTPPDLKPFRFRSPTHTQSNRSRLCWTDDISTFDSGVRQLVKLSVFSALIPATNHFSFLQVSRRSTMIINICKQESCECPPYIPARMIEYRTPSLSPATHPTTGTNDSESRGLHGSKSPCKP